LHKKNQFVSAKGTTKKACSFGTFCLTQLKTVRKRATSWQPILAIQSGKWLKDITSRIVYNVSVWSEQGVVVLFGN
jgi:hypothetical protein